MLWINDRLVDILLQEGCISVTLGVPPSWPWVIFKKYLDMPRGSLVIVIDHQCLHVYPSPLHLVGYSIIRDLYKGSLVK